ncbi:MAG: hypothetical protein Q7S59_09355 [Sulfurimonas sp.]|nr:hypothetical protein [Sulfurimonas sp.]
MMRVAIFILIATLFLACGYTPSSKFAREVIGEKISTNVIISDEDPENSVIIKDAVDAAIIEVFHASVTSRTLSQTHLILKLSNPLYVPTQYNSNGFVVGYRATITLNITREQSGLSKHYATRGTYDFSVSPNAVITDQERFDAIKFSSEKAIKSFIAKVSADGARENNKKE